MADLDPKAQAPDSAPAAAPPVDVQAEIQKALTAQQAEFQKQLKAATGHSDIQALTDAQLKAQGKLQELADAKAAEAQSYKNQLQSLQIRSALLAACQDAIDADTVCALLAPGAVCDEAGRVTIDGVTAGDAVKAFLLAKPFLAKAQGGAGSGAPQQAGSATKNPWSKQDFNLTEQIRIKSENPTLAAQLKAAAR